MPPSTNVFDEARDALERTIRSSTMSASAERALAELGGKVTRRGPGRPRGSANKKAPPQSRRRHHAVAAVNAVAAPAPTRR